VELRAPTIWAGMGQDKANAFITAAGSKPAAKSISEIVIANSTCRMGKDEKFMREVTNEENKVKITEVPAKDVRRASRMDATGAERGGREPRSARSNCARNTSSASGREKERGHVDANLREYDEMRKRQSG
jgi:hypothetical protein